MACAQSVLGVVTMVAALHGSHQVVPKDKNVKVTVVVILACTRSDHVDQRLKCIAEEVRKKEPQLTGFRLKWMDCKSLAVNQKSSFDLVENQQAHVVIHHGADEKNWVCLKVKPPLQGEITYRTVCGKFLPIVTRYRTKDNERLILAICVQPCKGK